MSMQKLSTFRLVFASIAGLVLMAAIVFWPAGRLDWPQGWLHFAIVFISLFVNFFYLQRVNPEVIVYRLHTGPGTKTWDKLWSVLFAPVFFAIYIIAGFDAVRYQWTSMVVWLWPLGLLFWVCGFLLLARAMGVNPFFEKTVRIQHEREQRVIDSGPYAFIRHPGYLGFFGWCLSIPLLLGSWWAFVPAVLSMFGIAVRTALEDRTLQNELKGYREYAKRVRYRLIPGIW